MLISTQYLHADALTNYIAALEGGLRQSGTSRSMGTKGLGGAFGAGPVKIEGKGDRETEETLNVADHDAARLARLIAAGHADPEEVGWEEVLEPDTVFPNVALGTLIEWECDIFIPDIIKALSKQSGLGEAINQMQLLMPAAETLRLDMEGVPSAQQMQAVASLVEGLDVAPVVVGEDSETDWRIVGALDHKWLRPGFTLDDRVRIIGKVKKRIDPGRWYPLSSLPGMNLVGREERRRMERHGPGTQEDKANYVPGPAVVVEYLAIYS